MRTKQKNMVQIEFFAHEEPSKLSGIWRTIVVAELSAVALLGVLVIVHVLRTVVR